jgi:hypothetical protein
LAGQFTALLRKVEICQAFAHRFLSCCTLFVRAALGHAREATHLHAKDRRSETGTAAATGVQATSIAAAAPLRE